MRKPLTKQSTKKENNNALRLQNFPSTTIFTEASYNSYTFASANTVFLLSMW